MKKTAKQYHRELDRLKARRSRDLKRIKFIIKQLEKLDKPTGYCKEPRGH